MTFRTSLMTTSLGMYVVLFVRDVVLYQVCARARVCVCVGGIRRLSTVIFVSFRFCQSNLFCHLLHSSMVLPQTDSPVVWVKTVV